VSDATVAAEYGCTIYELRKHRKAGEKYCKHRRTWKPAKEYPLKGGPNSKRRTWCVTCLAERGQAACTAEERCTPEMRARMAELLSLITGEEVIQCES
jgi:hypothetical protein